MFGVVKMNISLSGIVPKFDMGGGFRPFFRQSWVRSSFVVLLTLLTSLRWHETCLGGGASAFLPIVTGSIAICVFIFYLRVVSVADVILMAQDLPQKNAYVLNSEIAF